MKKFLWLFILVAGVSAHAQSSFLIPVTTTTGQAVPGASVQLQCQSGGCGSSVYTSTADATGNAVFSNVKAGRYTVTTFGAGVQTYSYTYDVSSPNPSSLNNIIFVDGVTYTTTDIFATLNSIYTACPSTGCGDIYIPPGTYSTATALSLSTGAKYFHIHGAGAGVTIINYTPTTATTALTIDAVPSSGNLSWVPSIEISDLTVENNGQCVTNGGCGSSATGIAAGLVNYGLQNAILSRVEVLGFGVGFSDANTNSWGVRCNDCTFARNNLAVSLSGTLERMTFDSPSFMTNGTAIKVSSASGTSVVIIGGSCDGNTGGADGVACYEDTGANSLSWQAPYAENLNCTTQNCVHYISGASGSQSISGGIFQDDTAGAANRDYMLNLGNDIITGTRFNSSTETFTNVIVRNIGGTELVVNGSSATLTNICPTSVSTAVKCMVQQNGLNVGNLITPFGSTNQTGLTGNLGSTTLYTTSTAVNAMQGGSGQYRVCVNAYATATGSATAIVPNVGYNNGAGAIVRALPTLSLSALTNASDACVAVYSNTSQAIYVNTTGYSGTGTFALRATVEQIN